MAPLSTGPCIEHSVASLAPSELTLNEVSFDKLPLYGGLKNAIDWASRPYGQNAFARKPVAIIGTSPGKIGTAVAQSHLRSIMAFYNAPLMNSIEAYIQFESGLISDDGVVTNPKTAEFLGGFMNEFQGFITRVYTVLQRNP